MSVSTPSSENTPRGPHVKQTQPCTHLDCLHSMPAQSVCKRAYVPEPHSTCGAELFLRQSAEPPLGYLRTASAYFSSGA